RSPGSSASAPGKPRTKPRPQPDSVRTRCDAGPPTRRGPLLRHAEIACGPCPHEVGRTRFLNSSLPPTAGASGYLPTLILLRSQIKVGREPDDRRLGGDRRVQKAPP